VSKDSSLDTALLSYALISQRLVTWLPLLKKVNAEMSSSLTKIRKLGMRRIKIRLLRERTIQKHRLMMKRAKVSLHLLDFGIIIELVVSL
jgi:hypothetical protein